MIDRNEIEEFLVNDIFLKRLELEEDGYVRADFSEDTLILDDTGLALDSVDVLDLFVGIEKAFQLKPEAINGDFIESKCRSIGTLIDFVIERTRDQQSQVSQA